MTRSDDAFEIVRRLPRLPARRADAHKGTFGTVLIVAGSEHMLGAAILCARAALRGGAGLVQVGLPDGLLGLLPLAVAEATTSPRTPAALRTAVAGADALVVGPGLGDTAATRRMVGSLQRLAVAASVPLLLDADALNVLAPLPRAAAKGGPVTVATPHPGEAARLLGTDAATIQRDRPAALAALCRRLGGVVVLKGHRTLVGDGRRCYVNRSGNPGMATGGAGDVLAGLCGALLAAGMPPFDAACLAVHVHGRAGDRVAARIGQHGLCASDLPLAIAEELG